MAPTRTSWFWSGPVGTGVLDWLGIFVTEKSHCSEVGGSSERGFVKMSDSSQDDDVILDIAANQFSKWELRFWMYEIN